MGKKRKGGERAIGAARILKYFFGFGLGGGRKGRVEHGQAWGWVGQVRGGGREGVSQQAKGCGKWESGQGWGRRAGATSGGGLRVHDTRKVLEGDRD